MTVLKTPRKLPKPKAQTPDDPVLPLDRWPDHYRKLQYGAIGNGYIMDPEDSFHIIPNPEHIFWIEKAFDYLDAGNSLRETAEWLSQKIHKSLVHQTLGNLYKKHRKPYNNFKTYKRTARKLTAADKKVISARMTAIHAAKKADKIEHKVKTKKRQEAAQLKPEDFETPREPSPFEHSKDKPFAESSNRNAINILFKPNKGPQTEFLAASEQEILYGGSAGGGKTYAMIADPMRYFHNPNFVGLLIRRTNDELKEIIREQRKLYPKVFPGADFKVKDSVWMFPSGAELWVTYLDRDEDVYRYQGQSFCWIGIDELTQYSSPFPYLYLKSRLRTTDPDLKKYLCMRATSNPGGPGHGWVKKMFVDPALPNEAFWATDIDTGEVLTYPENHHDPELAGRPLFKRRFIPARLYDNPYLAEDGAYERSLLGLPEDQRRKLLDGDWSIMEGAAFSEFTHKLHVCESFTVPDGWRKFRAGDFGYASHSAVLWFAIDPDGTLYVYRELYVSKKTGRDLAQIVKRLEQNDMNMAYGVLDSSVWHKRGHFGPSIAEEMIQEGCRWKPSDRTDGSRIAGKNRLHELLKVNPWTQKPGLIIFENCRQLIADLPMIPSDPDGGEDIDDRYQSDHTYDALRYGIMSRPRPGMNLDYGNKSQNHFQPFDPQFGY
jgi:hypothetical protein